MHGGGALSDSKLDRQADGRSSSEIVVSLRHSRGTSSGNRGEFVAFRGSVPSSVGRYRGQDCPAAPDRLGNHR